MKDESFKEFVLDQLQELDDPTRFKPSMDFFTSSAQPWDHMNLELPKFHKMPSS
jgi:hypothetical protein